MLAGVTGLSDTRGSVNPYSSNRVCSNWILGGDLVAVDIFLELQVITDRYYAFSYCLLRAHCDELCIPSLEISFDVSLSWLNACRPGTFDTSLFLVAVVIRTIIEFN